MAIYASKFHDTLPVAYGDCAGDVVLNNFFIDVTAAQLLANNIFDIGIIPAGHTIVDATLLPDDLDTNASPTITLDVGVMSGTPGDTVSARTVGTEFFSASNAAQTGTMVRATLASSLKVLPTQADRSIGVKVVTGAATAAAGRIRLQVLLAPADHTLQF